MTNESATCNIGIIGPAGHGKTTLFSAIPEILRTQCGFSEDDLHNLRYTFLDCDSPAEYANEDAPLDSAILVLDIMEGPASAEESISAASQAGIPSLIVFLNKSDLIDDEELLELAELEIRQLLDEYEYSGEYTPFLYGSALMALQDPDSSWSDPILDILEAL